jgi:hypothetical protein
MVAMTTKSTDPGIDAETPVDPDAELPELRLAVISTPRSGNTWVREVLAAVYELEQMPAHYPEQLPWGNLPRRCILQIHWYRDERFTELLEADGVRLVVLARHPFDVLMSWLNHVYYVHLEGICLEGQTCNECGIVGVLPRSAEFLDYACGRWGRYLLGYSPAWWDWPGAIRAHYEDLVADPEASFGRILGQIGEKPRRSLREALERNAIPQKKAAQKVRHFHFWQGQPGVWRSMLPAAEARAIAAAHPEPFDVLGYACDPDETLEAARADRSWLELQLDSTREQLRLERLKHERTDCELAALRSRLALSEPSLADKTHAGSE